MRPAACLGDLGHRSHRNLWPDVQSDQHPARPYHGADVGIFKTELSHFDTCSLGSNALTFGVQQSNGEDPAEHSKRGAPQWYGGYMGTLSGNRVFDTQAFTVAPVKDARLDFGFDFNQKNFALENRKREIVFGPSLSFDVPGTLVVGFHVAKEWNHNGIVRKYLGYDPAFQPAIFGSRPLGFTGLPLRLQTIGVIETPKGRDGFGRRTTTSFLSSYDLILDVGALAFNMPQRFDAFVGFQYWPNKTGDDHAIKAGSVEETAVFGLTVHFIFLHAGALAYFALVKEDQPEQRWNLTECHHHILL